MGIRFNPLLPNGFDNSGHDSGGTVTNVSASSPLSSSGGNTPNISLTGTVSIVFGGTGASTSTVAFNNLAPSQTGNSGKYLTTNGSTTSWGTVSVSPGGSNTQIQFNDSGSFGGDADFVWDKTNNFLGIGQSTPLAKIHATSDTTSGTIGTNAVIIGRPNSTANIGAGATILGGNSTPNSAAGANALVTGTNCSAGGSDSIVGGNGCSGTGVRSIIAGTSNVDSGAGNNALFGGSNTIGSGVVGALISGSNNSTTTQNSFTSGSTNSVTGYAGAVFGEGTIAQAYCQLALGRYNIAQGTGAFPPVSGDTAFIIGNGTASGSRHNAFAVLNTGESRHYGSTSGYFGIKAAAATTDYTVTAPASQGPGPLTNDGSGNLYWLPDYTARAFSSTTTLSGSLATVVYATESYDASNLYDNTTGIYSNVLPGKYQVNAAILVSGTIALNDTLIIEIHGNNTVVSRKTVRAGGVLTNISASISDIIELSASQNIRIKVSCSSTAPTIVSSNFDNYFSVAQVR